MPEFTQSYSNHDLEGILTLQMENLKTNLDLEVKLREGFVTVQHKLEDLQKLQDHAGHVIAREGNKIVGYVLAMTQASRYDIPVLVPMFDLFDRILYKEKPVSTYHYMVVGQVCIAKAYRGQGLFDACYEKYKACFSDTYDFAITEIASNNYRSLAAHRRIGFETLHTYVAPDGQEWQIVIWDWK
ncbi:MAG: GNAT family N-acetyltransferase [Saprospiraceae bacterium]|nr:GNAT family N-acetyltransferase [Saprospiraceae bacterium]